MSDSNRVAVRLVEESTFGVTPTNPVFEELRVTNAAVTFSPQTVTSNEIRPDRQVTDLILVGAEAGGNLGMELSYQAADKLLEGAMFSTWVRMPNKYNATADSSITNVDATADAFVVDAGGTAFLQYSLLMSRGFTTAANNGLWVVGAGATGTNIPITDTATLVNETAPPAGARLQVVGFEGPTGDIDATTSGGNAWTSTLLDFTDFNLVPGIWVQAVNFSTAACNGWYRVSRVAANRVDFDVVPTGFTNSVETATNVRVFVPEYIRNGVVEHSYTLERAFEDHDPVTYEYFRGMEVSNAAFQIEAQSIMTASFTFMGRDAVMDDAGRFSGATTMAAPTNDVLNTSSNVGRIAESGTEVTGPNYVTSGSIQINNNLRRQNAIGAIGSVGIGTGEFNVSGNLNTYFGNKVLAKKVLENTASSYDLRVGRADGDKQTMLFDLPRMKFSSGSPAVQGKNQDVMVDAQYQAFRHPTLGYTLAIHRFWYTA